MTADDAGITGRAGIDERYAMARESIDPRPKVKGKAAAATGFTGSSDRSEIRRAPKERERDEREMRDYRLSSAKPKEHASTREIPGCYRNSNVER
jgi:hypothetical protein